jgi:hypothetical protein
MRVCPKCGFIEPQYWRNDRYKRDVQICAITDIEFDDPKLALAIKEGEKGNYDDGTFNYHLTKKGYVVRRANIEGKAWQSWDSTFEAHHKLSNKMKEQTKLLEVLK